MRQEKPLSKKQGVCSVCEIERMFWTLLLCLQLQGKKMRCVIFCLSFVSFSHLRGHLMHMEGNHSLECLSDYLFTITCVLNVSSDLLAHSSTSWLEFYDYSESHKCMLKAQSHCWVCELDLSLLMEGTFTDTDFFQISLNYSYHGNSSSVVLDMFYKPVKHICPVPPSDLSLLWEADRAVFHWLSGYQENASLVQNLQYQLRIYSDDQVLNVHPVDPHIVVGASTFMPHTEYKARVRSSPSQVHYEGVWSQWSSAIHWTTGASHEENTSYTSFWFALFCLLPVFGLVLSYSRWKRHALIPSPEPYIRDFKNCTALPRTVGELLQREECLKIDSMIEDLDSTHPPSPAHYENMRRVYDHLEPTFITPSAPPTSPSMIHPPERVVLSSGSWLWDFTAVESGSVTYSEDYCTLSHTHTEHATN